MNINDANALSLFAKNPFPDSPPKFVRAILYRYHFASPDDPSGAWWTRDELGEWLPPLSSDDPRLLRILRQAGWIGDLGANGLPRIPITHAD